MVIKLYRANALIYYDKISFYLYYNLTEKITIDLYLLLLY